MSGLACRHVNERSDVTGIVYVSLLNGPPFAVRAENAEVYLHKGAYTPGAPAYKMTKTDAIGRYYFNWLRKGTYSLSSRYVYDTVSYFGHSEPFSVDGKFSEQNNEIDFLLLWK